MSGRAPTRAVRHFRLRHRVRTRAGSDLQRAARHHRQSLRRDGADLIFILVAGCFIDGSVLIIMLTPIFLPIIRDLDGDPVHFGLVFIVAATIGNFTPPVGAAMYAVCSILRYPINDYTRESLPFLVAVGVVTLILVFVPEVVLFVPNLLFGRY